MALLLALSVVLVIAGLAGVVMPGLPGPVLVFAGLALAAWSDGFARVGMLTIVLLAIVTLATYLVDVGVMALGMKQLGATRRAAIGAAIGALGGVFLGLPGLIVGPFVGAVVGELTVRPDLRGAGRAGLAAWLGFVLGTAAKVSLIFVMIGVFLTDWFVV